MKSQKPKTHPGQIDKRDAKRLFEEEFGKTKRDDRGKFKPKPKPKKDSN